MPWRARAGFVSLTFHGRHLFADANGDLDISSVPPELEAVLSATLPSHGFSIVHAPAPAAPKDPIGAMTRSELLEYLSDNGVPAMSSTFSNETLRALAREIPA